MRVLVTGSSGFVGKKLANALLAKGYEPILLKRTPTGQQKGGTLWIPEEGICELNDIGQVDAVVHLAGEPVLGYWTRGKKSRIFNSRINGTSALVEAILKNHKPSTFLCASGTGAYGNKGEKLLTEDEPLGDFFLSTLSDKLEGATSPLERSGTRVVHMIFGTVMGANAGSLKVSVPLFKLGLGADFGTGNQWYPWISIRDAISAITFCLENDALQGRVNIVSPQLVRSREYTKALAKVLSRPAFLKVPAALARLVFSKGFADEILLNSAKVEPRKLKKTGFIWDDPELDKALRSILR